MSVFKTTEDIFKFPWNYTKYDPVTFPPDFVDWDYSSILSIPQVDVWEEIYYEPGNFGIYASWNPKAEYYIIVYDLLPDATEEYYGQDSENKVKHRARELGIVLDENQVWINPRDEWLYELAPSQQK
jgi:hypothetical protein